MHSSRTRAIRCSSRLRGRVSAWGWGGGCLPVCPGVCTYPPPWTEFLTHDRENITFPQLRFRTVIISVTKGECFKIQRYHVVKFMCWLGNMWRHKMVISEFHKSLFLPSTLLRIKWKHLGKTKMDDLCFICFIHGIEFNWYTINSRR